MASAIEWIKKGNTSSLTAALGNTGLAAVKGIAAAYTGSGAMFASAMHSVADAVNQGFVFAGSVLAERKPTRRFPAGFGRVINLFCMVAVLVVSFMGYETIREGIHLFQHPAEAAHLWINVAILAVAIGVDGAILWKAMKEINEEAGIAAKGLGRLGTAFRNVGRAAPPTRLVFYEDIVATSGSVLALIAVVVAQLTPFKTFDGIATALIGCMMIAIAFRVGYDNMIGLIGVAAPRAVEEKVANLLLEDPDVVDIQKMRILQEGRAYHVEAYLELTAGISLAEAGNIKLRLIAKLKEDPDITDATLGMVEDDKVKNWVPEKEAWEV